jgi:hypothetical protein
MLPNLRCWVFVGANREPFPHGANRESNFVNIPPIQT